MAERARRLMTVDEFLAWDDANDTRYELVDGALEAMAPPSDRHGIIVANIIGALRDMLRSSGLPCRAQVEAGLRITDRRWWQADGAGGRRISLSPAGP